MWGRALVLQLLVGCGRVGFRSLEGPGDGGNFDTRGTDTIGSVDALTWSMPQLVSELMAGVSATQDPSLTGDRLEMYFTSGRAPACVGGTDIWRTTRAIASDPWSTPTCVVALSSTGYEASPEISDDGLTVYWSSDRTPSLGGRDIYVSTRVNRTSPWSAPARVAVISTAASEANLAISGDGKLMAIDTDQSGNRDLYLSTWSGTAWSTPSPIVAVMTADSEGAPGLDYTGSKLYFSRGVEADQTSFDIYVSDGIGGVFGPAVPVDQLNSSVQDGDPFPTRDGHMFMSSTRGGSVDLYEAELR